MAWNVAQKLIRSHLLSGEMTPGREIGLRVDQTLTQDATGTLVMLELEAMGLDRVKTEVSVQYVDHNLLQTDNKNADDHFFLFSACRRFGIWYSGPGNGVSHPVHMERFGKPAKTLLGSDSHTCAAGSLGMLAVGAGGMDVALAMAGEPFYIEMPRVWGVKLIGALPDWVSAKDVILELLRRHDVDGGIGCIIEYYGPGLSALGAMDRHVIANMGAELGATASVFPSDERTREFLSRQGRAQDWVELQADEGAAYDIDEELDLSSLEPLIALPSSPGKVVPVREVAGKELYQSYIGSSANPGFRDFAIAALMVRGRRIAPQVSFDVNPASRQLLQDLAMEGLLTDFIQAGARLHQAGCNGCIGMGQAPATGRNSLRTVPRNFPGRSGTKEDSVFLCSPETATASALTGVITDPRTLDMPCPRVEEPRRRVLLADTVVPPAVHEPGRRVDLLKAPHIESLPELEPIPDLLELEVLLKAGDDVSTDEILAGGSRVLPFRSNISKISQFVFEALDSTYPRRALRVRDAGGHAVIGGSNYGQGSSREHAALAPRFLGLRMVIAKGFARIHLQNLINFGVLPLVFLDPADYEVVEAGDVVRIANVRRCLAGDQRFVVELVGRGHRFSARSDLSERESSVVRMGGLTNWIRERARERASNDAPPPEALSSSEDEGSL